MKPQPSKPVRITLIVEYDSWDKVPPIKHEKCYGGTIVNAEFYDVIAQMKLVRDAAEA